MATANPLVCSPNPVPSGSAGTIAVTFQTSSGTPDVTANITLTHDGQVQQTGSALLKGLPPEAMPNVSSGNTGQGWELQISGGTLVPGPQPNTFLIHA